jgi:DNA invertase Pin-like site-specific DNA recombinase
VECIDRLGRNGKDLDDIVEALLGKSVEIHFVREGIILGKKNDLMSKLCYDMMKSFVNFFSQLAKDRQRIGVEKAKKDGKYRGKKSIAPLKILMIKEQLATTRKTKSQIAKDLGISRPSVYKYMKEQKA